MARKLVTCSPSISYSKSEICKIVGKIRLLPTNDMIRLKTFALALFVICASIQFAHSQAVKQEVAAGAEAPAGVRLIIKQGNNDVTGQTVSVFAGQKITLIGSTNTGIPIVTPTWTVPGDDTDRIAYWNPTDAVATLTPLTVLNQDNVVFYWLKKAENQSVTLSATVNGTPLQSSVKFTVVKPAHSVDTYPGKVWAREITAHPEVGLLAGKTLGFGDFEAAEPDFYGMKFSARSPNLYGGTLEFVQLLDSSVRTRKFPEGPVKEVNINIGSDGGYLYPSEIVEGGIDANDSPVVQTNDEGVSVYEKEDSFTMYLMWKPVGDSILVPLEKIKWGWKGKASIQGGIWQLDGDPTETNKPTPITKSDTDELPFWNAKAAPETVNWVTIPVN